MPPLPPPPSDDIWCIGWNLCIRMRVERTTSYPTNIILFFCVNCQINRIPFIKWCKSPKIDDTTTSPRQENRSILSRLVLYQRARLNSPRWWRYNVGITPPSIDVQKTVATWHFMGCIFIHGPNSPTLQLNPWFYPSSAMYWYVGALGAWILRLLRWYLH